MVLSMYETLIPDAQTFLNELALNNTRDWFHTNKDRYDDKLKKPALSLLDDITPRLNALSDLPVVSKVFRPQRDIRFSKDKTPYKTHMHMLWRLETGTRQDVVFFFGINLDTVTVGTGMMEFSKDVLNDWRKMADMDGDYMSNKIKSVTGKGYVKREPKLKRVPSEYGKDHPHSDLLRHKGLILSGPLDVTDNLPDQIDTAFNDLWPVSDMLIGVAETPTI